MVEDKRLSLIEHLEELRSRIIKSLISLIISSLLVYNFYPRILSLLLRPIGKLVFISPQEAFLTNIKIAFLGGLFLSSPVILYQIWKFVSVGLKPSERKYALIFGLLSFVFFVLGSIFGYFVIVPIGLNFLLGFASNLITPMITISRYVSFVGSLTFAFGLIFELPLILLFLTKLNLVSPAFLSRRRREAIILILISSALLTPPDVITQILMAFPLFLLYELGILFSKLGYKKSISTVSS